MITRTVSILEFADIVAKLDKRTRAAIIKGLQSGAFRMQAMIVEEIDQADPFPAVDRGELRGSSDTTLLPDGAETGVDAPHAPMIELGTRPFRPPLLPLLAWVVRKGLAATYVEAAPIARRIQTAIATRGMRPRHFMAKAFQRGMPVVFREVEAELAKL